MVDGGESKPREKESFEASLVRLLKELKPESLEMFAKRAEVELRISEREIINSILKLQAEGKIELKAREKTPSEKTDSSLRRRALKWYGITVVFLVMTTAVVLVIPEDSYPAAVLRQIFGSIFVLWWPGFGLVKALFPSDSQRQTLTSWEQVAVGVCMSIAVVAVVGLILNYTPWGVRLVPLVISLFSIAMLLATVGVVREYRTLKRV